MRLRTQVDVLNCYISDIASYVEIQINDVIEQYDTTVRKNDKELVQSVTHQQTRREVTGLLGGVDVVELVARETSGAAEGQPATGQTAGRSGQGMELMGVIDVRAIVLLGLEGVVGGLVAHLPTGP